ncbi:MAG: S49 family peptidase [Legionella sp.]|jgi:protease-4|nr:S49 family peptidase [Legionella sp.]
MTKSFFSNKSEHPVDSQLVLNQLMQDYLRDQKRKRRWRWVTRLFLLMIIAGFLYQAILSRHALLSARVNPHVGLVDVKGVIADGQAASAENVIKSLEHAYENKAMKALVLRIDSPGGSPVQADYMFNAIQHYKKEYPEIKTYAVCMDMCTSAAYYMAAATDEIYAAPSSMVGSIGVIYNGFGFVDGMQKFGVTRRLQTAGAHKALLDPFSPEKPEDAAYLQRMLDLVHQQFIAKVKAGRGTRLKINHETFSGLFWTGEQAKTMGLIDGFGSSEDVGRDVIKIEESVDYTEQGNVFEQFAKKLGAEVAIQLPVALGLKPGFH